LLAQALDAVAESGSDTELIAFSRDVRRRRGGWIGSPCPRSPGWNGAASSRRRATSPVPSPVPRSWRICCAGSDPRLAAGLSPPNRSPRVGLDGAPRPARLPATPAVFATGRASLRHVDVIARVLGSASAERLAPEQRAA